MALRENPVRAKLKRGEVAVGTMAFEFFTPSVPRILSHTGAEFVIYDMEHSGTSIETLRMLAAASRGPSPVPLARVPATEYHFMARALDAGMLGLMVPLVETPEQARKIVDSTKYPPAGHRGAGLGMAHDDYEGGDAATKIRALDDRTLLIAQIESPLGVENLEAIASVEGIDVLWVGHWDLSIQMGIPGQFESTRFQDAIKRVVETCDRHGLSAGVNVDSLATAEDWMGKGYRAIAYSTDFRLLIGGLKAGVEGVQKLAGR